MFAAVGVGIVEEDKREKKKRKTLKEKKLTSSKRTSKKHGEESLLHSGARRKS